MTPEQILQSLYWRYATKQFDPNRKISDDLWKALEQSLVLSPSSFGMQPWKFFVVSNADLRKQIQEKAWGQSQVVDASHLVVFAIQKNITPADVDTYINRMAEVRQMPAENLEGLAGMIKGFLDKPESELDKSAWAARQVYIALGFFMYTAALLEVDTCPMEGFDPAGVDAVLGLADQGCRAVVLCAAGYRSAEDKYAQLAKVRYETEDIVTYID